MRYTTIAAALVMAAGFFLGAAQTPAAGQGNMGRRQNQQVSPTTSSTSRASGTAVGKRQNRRSARSAAAAARARRNRAASRRAQARTSAQQQQQRRNGGASSRQAGGRATGRAAGSTTTGRATGTTSTADPAISGTTATPRPQVGPESTTPSPRATPNLPTGGTDVGAPGGGGAAVGATPGAGGANNTDGTLIDVLTADPQFSTLVRAIQAAGLADTLRTGRPYTLFAPTNTAFERLTAGTLDNLLLPANKAQLVALLNYHVLRGALPAASLTRLGNPATPQTLQGQSLRLITAPTISINNGAALLQTDIRAGNNVIHAIDTVLIPPPTGSPL